MLTLNFVSDTYNKYVINEANTYVSRVAVFPITPNQTL